MSAIFFYNPDVVTYDYGATHPFRLERIWLTEYICRRLELFEPPAGRARSFTPAKHEDLEAAHESAYLDALSTVSSGLHPPRILNFGLGTGDNPTFSGIWEYVLHTAGGSLASAHSILAGEARRTFHPGGGLHHAMPARASGFCYVNDVVLAIRRLVDAGQRVFYLDLDAHHGDGVQHGFYSSAQVLTLSVHQDGRTLFPGSGFVEETGNGAGAGYCVNVPLLPYSSDAAYQRVWAEIVEPLRAAFAPDVVVTELGADALLGDPLANLEMELRGWWELLQRIAAWDIPWLALGGGGYDIPNAMRAWALVWMAMLGREVPAELPPAPEQMPSQLSGLMWPADFWSAPIGHAGPPPGDEFLDAVIAEIRREIFPIHGL